MQRGEELVILLAGGDERTQDQDIQTTLELARNVYAEYATEQPIAADGPGQDECSWTNQPNSQT